MRALSRHTGHTTQRRTGPGSLYVVLLLCLVQEGTRYWLQDAVACAVNVMLDQATLGLLAPTAVASVHRRPGPLVLRVIGPLVPSCQATASPRLVTEV